MKNIEKIILKNLLKNEQFVRTVLPNLKIEYFQEKIEQILFEEIQKYILKYNAIPTIEAIQIALSDSITLHEDEFKDSCNLLEQINTDDSIANFDWLYEQSELWCQERALHNAILESISILDESKDHKEKKSKGSIPKILSDALGVSFDPSIGHDYIEDSDARYTKYHEKRKLIPFDLDYFNLITGGGIDEKTLTIILAGTNVGKSLMMCHFASASLRMGYNVLYISMEMSEEKVAARIDANLLDVTLDELKILPKDNYDRKIKRMKEKIKGKLIIKEYPTSVPSATHFRALLNDLSLKKQFKPSIIFVDYLNICSSSRIKPGNNVNSYTMIKSIAEELRGLAIEFKLPIVSATQTTRSGYSNSDPGLEDTSESFGLTHTADLMFAAITNEELAEKNQYLVKQLKNRDNDVTTNRRGIIGVDRSKMRLFDVPPEEQNIMLEKESPEEIYRSVGKETTDKFRRAGLNV